jgi:hypothetical protein
MFMRGGSGRGQVTLAAPVRRVEAARPVPRPGGLCPVIFMASPHRQDHLGRGGGSFEAG